MQEQFSSTELLPSIFRHISSYYLSYYDHDPRHFLGTKEQLKVPGTQTINPGLLLPASLSITDYKSLCIPRQGLLLLPQHR